MSLDFSALHLVIGEESPSAEGLKPAFSGAEDKYTNKDTCYLISKENLDNKYFWLCARYGKSLPYSSTVYNTKDQTEEDNPRSTDQIEPDKQLFALYCVHSRILYLSSTKKKLWVEEYLKKKLEKDAVVIKTFFKDVDEFIQKIKSVEKIRFVVKSDLFSNQGGIMKIFPSPNDLYGLGMPEDFTLEANFTNARLTDNFVECFKKMVGWKKSYEADSLLCIGRDDKNFETVFNVDSFIQKISVEATKDDQGLYDPATVKQALIRKIEGSYE
jgi:hypothetical protein